MRELRGGQAVAPDEPAEPPPASEKPAEPEAEGDAPAATDPPTPPATDEPPANPVESVGDLQWHLEAIQTPVTPVALGRVTVAVLDTGVAYRPWEEDGVVYAVPPSLRGVSFVDGVDLVDGDALPLDEHQHGTHITSLIASDGEVMGVAPGVSIMPVRVLDENN